MQCPGGLPLGTRRRVCQIAGRLVDRRSCVGLCRTGDEARSYCCDVCRGPRHRPLDFGGLHRPQLLDFGVVLEVDREHIPACSVLVPMWQGCRCGRYERSPGADVAEAQPRPGVEVAEDKGMERTSPFPCRRAPSGCRRGMRSHVRARFLSRPRCAVSCCAAVAPVQTRRAGRSLVCATCCAVKRMAS